MTKKRKLPMGAPSGGIAAKITGSVHTDPVIRFFR